MRFLTIAAIAVFGLAVGAAWVAEEEPDWYLRARYPLEYEHIVRGHAENHDLDPALLAAVVYVESGFDPNARSEAGALGLMQLLPETAKGIALRTGGERFVVADLRDPRSTSATARGTSTTSRAVTATRTWRSPRITPDRGTSTTGFATKRGSRSPRRGTTSAKS